MGARRFERDIELVGSVVVGRERVIGRQNRLAVATGEANRALVVGNAVAESIHDRHRDWMGGPRHINRRIAGHDQRLRERRSDIDGLADALGRGLGDVRHRDRLFADRLQCHDECPESIVAGREGIIGRQPRLRIGAAEVDRPPVAGIHLALGVEGPDGEKKPLAGRRVGRVTDQIKMRCRGDRDDGTNPGQIIQAGGVQRICSRLIEREIVECGRAVHDRRQRDAGQLAAGRPGAQPQGNGSGAIRVDGVARVESVHADRPEAAVHHLGGGAQTEVSRVVAIGDRRHVLRERRVGSRVRGGQDEEVIVGVLSQRGVDRIRRGTAAELLCGEGTVGIVRHAVVVGVRVHADQTVRRGDARDGVTGGVDSRRGRRGCDCRSGGAVQHVDRGISPVVKAGSGAEAAKLNNIAGGGVGAGNRNPLAVCSRSREVIGSGGVERIT